MVIAIEPFIEDLVWRLGAHLLLPNISIMRSSASAVASAGSPPPGAQALKARENLSRKIAEGDCPRTY
jgi:hypothetical protein